MQIDRPNHFVLLIHDNVILVLRAVEFHQQQQQQPNIK